MMNELKDCILYIILLSGIASSAGRGFQNKPVRGSDGNTYINVAFLDLASCLTKTYIQPVKTNTGLYFVQRKLLNNISKYYVKAFVVFKNPKILRLADTL